MDEFVCMHCFADKGLHEHIEGNAVKTYCSFCGEKANHPISIPIEDLLAYVRESIHREYDDAANYLPYESREGGYQGVTYEGYDLIGEELELDLPRDQSDKLRDIIAQDLSDCLWCDIDPFGLNTGQLAQYSWSRFAQIVKHERRFYFASANPTDSLDEALSPGELLDRIFDYAENMGLIQECKKGLSLYRARKQGDSGPWKTPSDLGPPKTSIAIQSNRMSPAGIVMFYGSKDVDTALRETVSGPGQYSVGLFHATRNVVLLDVSNLPPVPSIFEYVSDGEEVDPRRASIFLQYIAREISLPIARDDRVHVEYVPTQVVSEFLRTRQLSDGTPIDGILYRSAVSPGKDSCVLFATRDNVHGISDDPTWPKFEEPDMWLELVSVSDVAVSKNDIKGWKAEAMAGIIDLSN